MTSKNLTQYVQLQTIGFSVNVFIQCSCYTVIIARQQRSMLMHDIDVANLSVCPSVRNVPVSDENGLTYRHSFFHHTVAQSF